MRIYSIVNYFQRAIVTFICIIFLYFLMFTGGTFFFNMQVKEIFCSYFDTGAVDRINFDPEIVEGLQACKRFFFCKILSTNIDKPSILKSRFEIIFRFVVGITGPMDKTERLKMATLLSK